MDLPSGGIYPGRIYPAGVDLPRVDLPSGVDLPRVDLVSRGGLIQGRFT